MFTILQYYETKSYHSVSISIQITNIYFHLNIAGQSSELINNVIIYNNVMIAEHSS